jgi:Protein of unknown function (DUF3383)/PEP-CTERM motif
MFFKSIFSTALLASLASASIPRLAAAQVAPDPLDRLFLTDAESVPLGQTLSFNSVAKVENYFGATSIQGKLATQYFAGYTGSSANMLFSRFPYGGGRARLFGGNIAGLSISQLDNISGPLSLTSQGLNVTAEINLSGAKSFAAAATDIQNALDASAPVQAVTTGSMIAPVSVSFTGSVDQAVLTVNPGVSGYIGIGSYIAVPGINSSNLQIVAQISGTANGAGTYAIRNPSGNQTAPVEGMTDSYGELTVGSVASGTVAAGQQIAAGTTGVAPYTAIQSLISGNGAGSKWVLSSGPTQTLSNATLTTTAAPLAVSYNPLHGKTKNSGALWIEQWGTNDVLGSSITYASGSAAALLNLTQNTQARLSPVGEVATSPPAWMNNLIQTQGGAFSSFQNIGRLATVTQNGLQAWAQSSNGAYGYLQGSTKTTPPIIDQYALTRLFLDTSNKTPLGDVLSFSNATAVANFYGKTSQEAQLANEFYSKGSSGTMLFALYPTLPWRANLYGGNVTLPQVQAATGTLSVTSDGLTYNTGSLNLSGVTSLSAAAKVITTAFNNTLPVAATTTGSSIAAKLVPFSGSIKDAILTVGPPLSGPLSGPIEVGSYITGTGVPTGTQIISQISGTPNGAGVYGLFMREPTISTENLTDNYGVLTVGTVGSGTVAIGEQVGHAKGTGVAAGTEIAANLNGESGAGSTWIVNNAQNVGSENLKMTGAPLTVSYQAVTEAAGNISSSFWVHGNFSGSAIAASTLTYATGTGTAASDLGLAQGEAFYLTSTGGVATSASDWMNNFVATEANEFSSFQTTYNPKGATPPGLQNAMESWAKSTGGQYDYLQGYSAKTPPIGDNMVPSIRGLNPLAVPEPSTWAMVALGFAGLGLARYRPIGKWKNA